MNPSSHGAEEVVAHVRAEHAVLTLRDLRRQPHQDLLHRLARDLVLKEDTTQVNRLLKITLRLFGTFSPSVSLKLSKKFALG